MARVEVADVGLARRVFHRQMSIDLVRACLLDYGTQENLARALAVAPAYVSQLLDPVRPVGVSRREAYWLDTLSTPDYELRADLLDLEWPSVRRARQIANQLCSDRERREVLLDHMRFAREPPLSRQVSAYRLSATDVHDALFEVGEIHERGLRGADPLQVAVAYMEVWERARALVDRIDPAKYPLEWAKLLMYTHDAASVLNRHDLALAYAREAALVLLDHSTRGPHGDWIADLKANAFVAELVSLNSLGLNADAHEFASSAGPTPHREHWKLTVLQQDLTAMRGVPRPKIGDAERAADLARDMVGDDPAERAAVDYRLAYVYMAQGSGRSLKKAAELIEGLLAFEATASTLTPLRRVQIIRSAADLFLATGDDATSRSLLRRCRILAIETELRHQRFEIEVQYRKRPRLAPAEGRA